MATNYDGNRAMNGNNLYTFWVTIKALILGWVRQKQDTITGGASTITGDDLDKNRALISNGSGKVAVSEVTSTELGYLDGATGNVQNQLNAKVDTSKVKTTEDSSSSQAENVYSTGYINGKLVQASSSLGMVRAGEITDITGYIPVKILNASGSSSQGNGYLYVAETDISGKQDKMTVGNGTAGAVTTISAGTNIGIDISNGTATINNTYSLPTMTNAAVGGAKVFSNTTQTVAANAVTATAGRTYGVQKNSSGQLVVNVPWTDTPTDISGKQDKIKVGNAGVGDVTALAAGTGISITVDGTTATYTVTQSSDAALGGVKVHATYAGSAVQALKYCAGINSDTGEIGILPASTSQDGVMTSAMVTTLNSRAPLASPDFSGTPTISGKNIATQEYVDSAITGAETYKGTLASDADLKAYGNFKAGWYWRVALPSGTSTATIAGQTVESGDMVYCNVTHNHTAGAAITNANFNVVNTNIVFLTDTEIAEIVNAAS